MHLYGVSRNGCFHQASACVSHSIGISLETPAVGPNGFPSGISLCLTFHVMIFCGGGERFPSGISLCLTFHSLRIGICTHRARGFHQASACVSHSIRKRHRSMLSLVPFPSGISLCLTFHPAAGERHAAAADRSFHQASACVSHSIISDMERDTQVVPFPSGISLCLTFHSPSL